MKVEIDGRCVVLVARDGRRSNSEFYSPAVLEEDGQVFLAFSSYFQGEVPIYIPIPIAREFEWKTA